MRVSTVVDPIGTVTLVVAGTLSAECVADFDFALACARREGSDVAIDLSRVRLIDRPTLEYLNDLLGEEVRAVNCPAHLARWLSNANAPGRPARRVP